MEHQAKRWCSCDISGAGSTVLQKRRPSAAKFATVVAVSGGKATLKFDGETTATQKRYKYNAALSLKAGDRVKVNKISGTYVIEYKL